MTVRQRVDALSGFGDDATPGSSLLLRSGELDGPGIAMQIGGRLDPDDTTGQRSALYRQWHDTMRATASGLLARAQDAGAVRGDLDVADLLAAATGIAQAAADDGQASRLLAIVRDGLTSPAVTGAPGRKD